MVMDLDAGAGAGLGVGPLAVDDVRGWHRLNACRLSSIRYSGVPGTDGR